MKPDARRPTLADVATQAGVSVVTVSRVIEGSPKVAAGTRRRVTEAMQLLGYFGNAAASQLVSGSARTVCVITSNTADYGYASIIAGVEQEARAVGMSVLIAVIDGPSPESVTKTVTSVAAQPLAGVVVINFDHAAQAVLEMLPSYLPTVATRAPESGASTHWRHAWIDEEAGSIELVEHLLALGHRSVFYLAGPSGHIEDRRSAAVRAALDQANLPFYPEIKCVDWKPVSGYAAARQVLDKYGTAVTAIACGSDELAIGAMRAVFDAGLRVPDDVSVTGFDDDPVAAYARPSITTMRQDFASLGNAAFRQLMQSASPVEPWSKVPTLVARESTRVPHAERGFGGHIFTTDP